MIAICIDNLTAALARTPSASAPDVLDRDELQRRLEAIGSRTICLRPWDCHRYRVLALLYRLPDLRPEPRIAVLAYLDANLEIPPVAPERSVAEPVPATPVSGAETDAGTGAPQPELAADETDLPPSPPAEAPPPPARHPEDLFDRFLGWVAALLSSV